MSVRLWSGHGHCQGIQAPGFAAVRGLGKAFQQRGNHTMPHPAAVMTVLDVMFSILCRVARKCHVCSGHGGPPLYAVARADNHVRSHSPAILIRILASGGSGTVAYPSSGHCYEPVTAGTCSGGCSASERAGAGRRGIPGTHHRMVVEVAAMASIRGDRDMAHQAELIGGRTAPHHPHHHPACLSPFPSL